MNVQSKDRIRWFSQRCKTVVLVSALILGLISCNKDDGPTAPGGGGLTFSTTGFGALPVPSDISNLKGVLATIKISAQGESVVGAVAFFLDSSNTHFVRAGTATVNGTTLTSHSLSGEVLYEYPYRSSDPPLRGVLFDGSNHNWTVSGSGSAVPAFTASVGSPTGSVSISSPGEGSTIARNQGLAISYSASGNSPIAVAILDSRGHVLGGSASGSSYSFSPSQLATLAAGEGYVIVESYRYSIRRVDGKDYLLVAIIANGKSVTLQ